MTRTDPRPDEVDEPGAARSPAQAAGHAGVVTRVLAAVVDLGAVVLGAVLLDLGAAGVRFVWSPVNFRWPQPAVPVMGIAVVVVGVVYLTIAWATTGRTYGERLLGLRVLSRRFELLGWVRSFLRAVACVVFPVGLVWTAVSAQRHSLQDIVFRTVVVYDSPSYVPPVAPPHAGS